MSARRDRGRAAWRALAVLPASCLALALLACERPSEAQPSAEPPTPSAAAPAAAAAAPAAATPSGDPAPSAAATAESDAPVEKTSGSSEDEAAGAAQAPSGSNTGAAPSAATPAPATRGAQAVAAGDKGSEAAPAASTRERKRGSAVSEEPFSAWLEGDVPLAAGQPATLRVVLQAKPPYHTNAEYPHKFTLGAAPAGMTYPTPVVKGMQVTPAEGVLPVPVVAGAAGSATVKGLLSFSVCTDERCLIEKRELALDVDVR